MRILTSLIRQNGTGKSDQQAHLRWTITPCVTSAPVALYEPTYLLTKKTKANT